MWTYRAEITQVIDGDTVEAIVDLGFGVRMKQKFRLYGINAPEMRGGSHEAGLAAQSQLKKLIREGGPISLQTRKDKQEKYGRYLCTLWSGTDVLLNLNLEMIRSGHAVEYMP